MKIKKSVWFFGMMILILFGLFALSRPSPIKVVAVVVRKGVLVKEISDLGFTRFKTVHTVLAPLNGWFESTKHSTGEQLLKGVTLLATIKGAQSPLLDERSRSVMKAQVEAAKAQEKQARSHLKRLIILYDSNTAQLARLEKVFASGGVSAQELESARSRTLEIRSEISAAQATIDSLKHTREAAEVAVNAALGGQTAESLSIRASHSGLLSWIYDEKPRYVTLGTPLFDIAEEGQLYFEIDILAQESLTIKPGQSVRFSEYELIGKVRSVSPTALPRISPLGITEQRVRIWIDFISSVPKQWPSGLELEAHIETNKKENVLLVPLTAVWREGEHEYLFKIENNKLKKVKTTTGLQSLNESEILSGLLPGDKVVRFPSEEMNDGQKVSTGV